MRGCRRSLSLVLALGVGACARPPQQVVLITIDTLRADHVGSYGYARETTPEIDRFFAQGSVFENAISSAPCTVPSVMQLLRGSIETGPGSRTLAERLQRRGYATAAIVSQHQFHKRPDRYRSGFDLFDLQDPGEVDLHRMTARGAREVSDRALAWLERAPGDRPSFLWLHYFDPHDPYAPPPEHRGFDAGNRSRRSGDRRSDLKREKRSAAERARDAGYIFTPEDVAHLVNLYDGEIQYADREIGRVLRWLDAKGWTSHSIVALTADHGERLGRGGHWDHCASLSDDELRVPLLLRVNGAPLAGRARVRAPASTLDLAPTLLALLGEPLSPEAGSGRDLRDVAEERAVFASWRERWAVRRLDWKLVFAPGRGALALYHLASDPLEEHNRVGRGESAEAELARELESLSGIAARVERVNAPLIEELQALGYLE